MERGPSYWQAVNMAKRAGIDDLTDEQLKHYIELRDFAPSGEKGEKIPSSCGKIDQVLFDSVLNSKQSVLHRKLLPNIFPPEENLSTPDFSQPIELRQQQVA